MIQRAAIVLVAAALLGGCARNEYGIPLKKKPDLSTVQPGTPVNKVRGLKKPVKKEVLAKGDLKGAEAWLFEWDLPNDEVNNRMFTSVVVKDGVVLGWHEETADKWNKNSQLYKAARLDTALENLAAAQARLAYTQMAAGMIANYNATRPRYDPVQTASTMFANSYQPWKNSGTVNYGMVGGGPIAYGGAQTTASSGYSPISSGGGLRDFSRQQSGVVQDGKVYPTLPGGGLRDLSKQQSGVIQDGRIYPTLPGGGLRDLSKQQSGVIQDGKVYPTLGSP